MLLYHAEITSSSIVIVYAFTYFKRSNKFSHIFFSQGIPNLLAPKQPRSPSLGGRPIWVEREIIQRVKIPHTFVVHTYTRPTVCMFCKKLLRGLYKQGLQCKDCQYNTHKKCIEKIPKDCTGESPRDGAGKKNQKNLNFLLNNLREKESNNFVNQVENISIAALAISPKSDAMVVMKKEMQTVIPNLRYLRRIFLV